MNTVNDKGNFQDKRGFGKLQETMIRNACEKKGKKNYRSVDNLKELRDSWCNIMTSKSCTVLCGIGNPPLRVARVFEGACLRESLLCVKDTVMKWANL